MCNTGFIRAKNKKTCSFNFVVLYAHVRNIICSSLDVEITCGKKHRNETIFHDTTVAYGSGNFHRKTSACSVTLDTDPVRAKYY